jgi:periplasmic protein TonB
LKAPAVVSAPPLSASKLVADRRKVQRKPEREREHDTVTPHSAENGTESRRSEAATAAASRNHLTPAPQAKKPSGERVDKPAKELDIQQFQAAHIDDIRGKMMALLQYPAVAKRMKWHGLSTIGFVLHSSGEVTDLKVEKRSGHEILDKQALAAVQAAAPFDGVPKAVSVVLPV